MHHTYTKSTRTLKYIGVTCFANNTQVSLNMSAYLRKHLVNGAMGPGVDTPFHLVYELIKWVLIASELHG